MEKDIQEFSRAQPQIPFKASRIVQSPEINFKTENYRKISKIHI